MTSHEICPLLISMGVPTSNVGVRLDMNANLTSSNHWEIGLCLDCPQQLTCYLDTGKDIHISKIPSKIEEVYVQCPKCKTLETITLLNRSLGKTRKYTQIGDRIYHDCGSFYPCKLIH